MPRGKGIKKQKYKAFLDLTSSSSDEGQSTKAGNPKVWNKTISIVSVKIIMIS